MCADLPTCYRLLHSSSGVLCVENPWRYYRGGGVEGETKYQLRVINTKADTIWVRNSGEGFWRRRAQCQGSRAVFVQFWFGCAWILHSLIKNAQKSRKRMEPGIVRALRSLKSIQRNRPRAQVALKVARKQFKAVLSRWETAYNKENFYRGIRILLELQRNGSSVL